MAFDISVTPLGVQISCRNFGEPLVEKRYEPGDSLWVFLERVATERFGHLAEVQGKTLVSVDVHWYGSQFSFK